MRYEIELREPGADGWVKGVQMAFCEGLRDIEPFAKLSFRNRGWTSKSYRMLRAHERVADYPKEEQAEVLQRNIQTLNAAANVRVIEIHDDLTTRPMAWLSCQVRADKRASRTLRGGARYTIHMLVDQEINDALTTIMTAKRLNRSEATRWAIYAAVKGIREAQLQQAIERTD